MPDSTVTPRLSESANPGSSRPPWVVIVVGGDPQIRRLLRNTLAHHGYRLYEATTGTEGLQETVTHRPDLVILDLGLPDMDGLEVIRRLRAWTETPIVVLSARGREGDTVAALDAGADDYISKPFGVEELLVRMRAVLRRAARLGQPGQAPDGGFAVGELRVDLRHRRVTVGGQEVHLTPIEYRLLTVLVKHPGEVLMQRQLLMDVWGPTHAKQTQYLRVCMRQLRRKLEADPSCPKYLLTEPRIGYRLTGV